MGKSSGDDKNADKQDRLAQALRENLRRRKSQSRERRDRGPDTPSSDAAQNGPAGED